MSDLRAVRTDAAPAPLAGAPYSQALVAGELVFVSGQIPLDPATGALVAGGIVEQTHRVFANLRAVLEAAGSGLDRVVKTSVFMLDLGDFGAMNEVYGGYVGDPPPARSTFQVAKLPAGASIEIECVALRG
jgi:2-iminobutanoate/2-iminopropanoate deaminase